MKLSILKTVTLTGIMAFSAVAQDFFSDTKTPEQPDKGKLSYALGMRLGLQLKEAGASVDPDVIAQAIKDVLDGKPTQLQESEIRPIMMQAQAYDLAKKSEKNRAESEAFMAKNAKAPGITVLPDGLQYRILQAGTGATPTNTDLLVLNLRGNYMDDTEFRHKDHLVIPLKACPKSCQDALQLMKVGSKWQLFVPIDLAYAHGRRGSPGTETMLIYELELVAAESESAHTTEHYGGGRLGHPLDEDFYPPRPGSGGPSPVNQIGRPNVISNSAPQSAPGK